MRPMTHGWILSAIVAYCLTALAIPATAWNSPAHMLSGALANQILQREHTSTVSAVTAILKHHPSHAERWRKHAVNRSEPQQSELLFMHAAAWADEIRARGQSRGEWHYINWPFKPAGEPSSIRVKPPAKENILTAWAENERLVKTGQTAADRATALAWLFHLAGDIHQPLHTAQLFTAEYPDGDRGGNEICIRPGQNRRPITLHAFWDGVITSSGNINRLRNEATRLRNSPEFSRHSLTELVATDFEPWAKESFEIAVKIAYQNGAVRGSPKRGWPRCGELSDSVVLPAGYAANAGAIAKRRIALAGYRLADVLKRVFSVPTAPHPRTR